MQRKEIYNEKIKVRKKNMQREKIVCKYIMGKSEKRQGKGEGKRERGKESEETYLYRCIMGKGEGKRKREGKI